MEFLSIRLLLLLLLAISTCEHYNYKTPTNNQQQLKDNPKSLPTLVYKNNKLTLILISVWPIVFSSFTVLFIFFNYTCLYNFLFVLQLQPPHTPFLRIRIRSWFNATVFGVLSMYIVMYMG